ncbi:hypothetical protein [Streptomyces virginiae]|uniref:hypothetical protein n=1 Tax=Streptomyces virginiae TaxID=1961 RepID=UPI002F913392|nr:hypothetical protein OG253_41975 [Streptomyces virginiae]
MHTYLVIKLSDGVRDLPAEDRPHDGLGRTSIGWEEGQSPQHIYKNGRGIWPLDPKKVEACDYALFCAAAKVRAIVKITGEPESGLRRTANGPQGRAIVGDIVTKGPIYSKWFEADAPAFSTNARQLIGYVTL